ncbi:MAG: TonB family protein [Bacteroidales bacterium]|nr:TonB family protein [Bacteroidales bacterium]
MYRKFLLMVCLALFGSICMAQNVENDTIYDCDSISYGYQPDFSTVSSHKTGTGWRKFIEKFAVYPSIARQNHISGTSVVSVIIYKDGSRSKPEIVQSSDSLLDAEALRVVSLMPEFRRSPMNIRMKIPVHFRIYGDLKTEITTYEKKQPTEYKVNAYFACYFGWSVLDYPNADEFAFLDEEHPLMNGTLEMFEGCIFRNDKKLAFSVGGGLRNMHYFFQKSFSLKTNDNHVYGDSLTRESDHFKRHTLRVVNLSVPLGMHFRFNSKKEGKCELSFSLMGNMRVGCRERQVYKVNGARKKVNIKDDFLIRRFSYDLALEFTNHCVSVRLTGSPLSFFKKDVTPEVHCFCASMGFRFGGGQTFD